MQSRLEQFMKAAEAPGLDLVGPRKGDEFPIQVSPSPAEHKQDEEESKRSEESYRSLFQNAVFGIFRSTPAGYFTDANPALCSMLGYDSVEELLQRGSTFDVFQNSSQRLSVLEELKRSICRASISLLK